MTSAQEVVGEGSNTELISGGSGQQIEAKGQHTKGKKQKGKWKRNEKPKQTSVPAGGLLVDSKDKCPDAQKSQQLQGQHNQPKSPQPTQRHLSTKDSTTTCLQGCQDLQNRGYPRHPFMLQPVDWQAKGPGHFTLWTHTSGSDAYVPHCFYHATLGWCLPTFFVNPSRLDKWCLAYMQHGPAIIVSSEYHPSYGYAARVQVCKGPMNKCTPVPQQPPRATTPARSPLAPKGAWVTPLRPAVLQQSEQQQHWEQSKQAKNWHRQQGKAAAAAAVREAAAALAHKVQDNW